MGGKESLLDKTFLSDDYILTHVLQQQAASHARAPHSTPLTMI